MAYSVNILLTDFNNSKNYFRIDYSNNLEDYKKLIKDLLNIITNNYEIGYNYFDEYEAEKLKKWTATVDDFYIEFELKEYSIFLTIKQYYQYKILYSVLEYDYLKNKEIDDDYIANMKIKKRNIIFFEYKNEENIFVINYYCYANDYYDILKNIVNNIFDIVKRNKIIDDSGFRKDEQELFKKWTATVDNFCFIIDDYYNDKEYDIIFYWSNIIDDYLMSIENENEFIIDDEYIDKIKNKIEYQKYLRKNI